MKSPLTAEALRIKTHFIHFIALNSVCQLFMSVFISQGFVGATFEAKLKDN